MYSLWNSIAGGLAGSVVSNGGTMEIRYCYAYDEILLNYGNEQMQAGKLIGSFKTTYDNNAFCKLNNCYYDADNIPVSGYEELCQNEGAYSFTDLTGFGDKNAKTIAANYSLKKYSSDDSSPELGDNVWILSDGDVPKLYFEKEKYAISYYLDDELVSIKYYRKGDKSENPERYYRNDYISTDWEFSEDDFDGIMPAKDISAYAHLYKSGDVDGDGELTIKDVTLIQKYLADVSGLEGTQLAAADTDANGVINIQDCTEIQMYNTHCIATLNGSKIPDAQIFSAIPNITLTLKDGTPQQWLANDKAVFELYDKISGISYPMEKTGCVWVAEIPPTVSLVIIKRLNPSNNAVWNSWETEINGSTFTATSSKSGSWP